MCIYRSLFYICVLSRHCSHLTNDSLFSVLLRSKDSQTPDVCDGASSTCGNYIAMNTPISDNFILPAFLVPSTYCCVCFLIEGGKKNQEINSYKLSINRCCVFS